MNDRPKTILCDIDGVLIPHKGNICFQSSVDALLVGALEAIRDWDLKGYSIILITGRRESTRKETEGQLRKLGIVYDKLIMGVGGGTRVLINDLKNDSKMDTAIAINLKRNEGLKNVKI